MNIDVLAVESSVKRSGVGTYITVCGSAEVVCPTAVDCKLDLIVQVFFNFVECDLINLRSDLFHVVDVVVGIPVGIVEPGVLTVTYSTDDLDLKSLGLLYMSTGNGDFFGVGIEGNGNVTFLGHIEHHVVAFFVAVSFVVPAVVGYNLEFSVFNGLYSRQGD